MVTSKYSGRVRDEAGVWRTAIAYLSDSLKYFCARLE